MSPRTGRPPIENPKSDRITVRLDDYRSAALQNCADHIGTTKADILCRGIDLLEIADKNSKARQLFDAINILYDLMRKEERHTAQEYDKLYKQQVYQIESIFKEFMETVKK